MPLALITIKSIVRANERNKRFTRGAALLEKNGVTNLLFEVMLNNDFKSMRTAFLRDLYFCCDLLCIYYCLHSSMIVPENISC